MQTHIARELHFAVGEQFSREIRHGADQAREAEHRGQQFVLEHAVLHRQRVLETQVLHGIQCLRGLDGLGGDDQRAGVEQFGRVIQHLRPRLDVRESIEHQALALQRPRALAARDHHHLVAGAGQVRAQDGAERARAQDCEFHLATFMPCSDASGYFFRYLSNHARMLSTLAMRFDGRATMPPCEASGMRTISVSILRSLSAW